MCVCLCVHVCLQEVLAIMEILIKGNYPLSRPHSCTEGYFKRCGGARVSKIGLYTFVSVIVTIKKQLARLVIENIRNNALGMKKHKSYIGTNFENMKT